MMIKTQAQVTSVLFQLQYDNATNTVDCNLIIASGSTTSISHRIQFDVQYTVVAPTGAMITIDSMYMPLLDNQNYEGTIPITWNLKSHIISPMTQPESDFFCFQTNPISYRFL